jgi:transposase InsO family protein
MLAEALPVVSAPDRTADAAAGPAGSARRRRLPKDEGDRQMPSLPSNILDRQFEAERPNQKWIADFTYIWTARAGSTCTLIWLCRQVELVDAHASAAS